MQYIPCNSALLAQETLFLTQKALLLPKDLQKVRKSRQILICDKEVYVRACNFRPSPDFSAGARPRTTSATLDPRENLAPQHSILVITFFLLDIFLGHLVGFYSEE